MTTPKERMIGAGSIGRLVLKSEVWKQLVAVSTGILLFGGTAAFADLNTGLVAYYPFDGNADDTSGNGHTGLVYGATLTTDRLGMANSAYSFDGAAYIECANTAGLNFPSGGLSLIAWARFTDSNHDNVIVSKHIGDQVTGYFIGVLDDHFDFYLAYVTNGTERIWSPLTYRDGAWHLVAGVYDGMTMTLYVDGLPVVARGAPSPPSNTASIRIGAINPGQYGGFFKGEIDDVRIYNRALSEAEIQELAVDADGDGVPDASDQCPNTPAGEVVNAVGCSISQLVPASWPWKNHGEYVSAVAKVATEFVAQGLITGAQKSAIVSAAARSDVGKRR